MMKTSFLVACVLLSVSAAPAPEAAKGGEKSAKLQWSRDDAQVYSTATGPQILAPEPTVLRVSDSIAPTTYHTSRSVYQSVAGSPLYAQGSPVYAQGSILPYSSTGRTVITTTGQPGALPDGYVWEHQGTSHIGHTSQAVHVKKQSGLAYSPAIPVSGYNTLTGYSPIPAVLPAYPSALGGAQHVLSVVPQHLVPYSLNIGARHGEVRLIGGRHAQYLNNQWFYISPEAAAAAGIWNQGTIIQPANPTLQTVVLANGQRVSSYAPIAPTVIQRPSVVDNKWYTKTNVRSAATPFYAQAPQYVEVAQSAARPVLETEEKDW